MMCCFLEGESGWRQGDEETHAEWPAPSVPGVSHAIEVLKAAARTVMLASRIGALVRPLGQRSLYVWQMASTTSQQHRQYRSLR